MQEYDKKNELKEEYVINCEVRIKKLLSLAGLNSDKDFKLYIDAVKMKYGGGYSIKLARNTDEVFVNSYNPDWTLEWKHLYPAMFRFFLQLQYITEHYMEDDIGTMDMFINALKNGSGSL